ncbi:MAG: hypothetical protein N2560_05000 [Ignavibacteria bacterium]|nr:hypothetical protein [Ignavibacteria bacterium]
MEYFGDNYVRGLKVNPNDRILIKPFKNDGIIVRGQWQFSSFEFVKFEYIILQEENVDS